MSFLYLKHYLILGGTPWKAKVQTALVNILICLSFSRINFCLLNFISLQFILMDLSRAFSLKTFSCLFWHKINQGLPQSNCILLYFDFHFNVKYIPMYVVKIHGSLILHNHPARNQTKIYFWCLTFSVLHWSRA